MCVHEMISQVPDTLKSNRASGMVAKIWRLYMAFNMFVPLAPIGNELDHSFRWGKTSIAQTEGAESRFDWGIAKYQRVASK